MVERSTRGTLCSMLIISFFIFSLLQESDIYLTAIFIDMLYIISSITFSQLSSFIGLQKRVETGGKHLCSVVYGSLPPETRTKQVHFS